MIKKFEKYLLLEKRFSKHTSVAYINDIKQFYKYAQLESSEITQNHKIIRYWIADMLSNKITSISVNRKISSLRAFYKYLQKTKKIETNPLEKIVTPKKYKRIPEFIPENKFDNFNQLFTQDFNGIRDKIVIEILYMTGIRRSELVTLKNNNVDTNKLQIKVIGKGNKQRLVPITKYLTTQINNYNQAKEQLEDYNKETFILTNKGKATYDKHIYRIVKKYMSIMSSVNVSPHTLRHTFATHLLNNGADMNTIKMLLGHANLSATQIYTHNSFEKINTIYKQAHPRA